MKTEPVMPVMSMKRPTVMKDAPNAPHIRVWGEEEATSDNLDDELHHEGEPAPNSIADSAMSN